MLDRLNKIISMIVAISFLTNSAVIAAPTVSPQSIVYSPQSINIPEAYGRVECSINSPKQPLVVLVKDAHCHYEAQKNIAKILEILARDYGINIVALEGGAGKLDYSKYGVTKNKEIKEKVTDTFVKQGYLSGPEYLAITKYNELPIGVYGIEDEKLYAKDFISFRNTLKGFSEIKEFIDALQDEVNQLKGKIYNQELLAFIRKYDLYKKNEIPLSDWIRYLSLKSQVPSPTINLVIKSIKLEELIDFSRVENERSTLIKECEKSLPREEIEQLVKNSLLFRLGKMSSLEYYKYLEKFTYNLKLKTYNLKKYIHLIKLQSKIDEDKLFLELDKLEGGIKEGLFKDKKERDLDSLNYRVNILNNLLNLRITREELRYFDNHRNEFTPDAFLSFIKIQAPSTLTIFPLESVEKQFTDLVNEGSNFYKVALERDEALIKNTLLAMEKENKDKAVMVVGGFHAEGIINELKKKNIDYIVITPKITKEEDTPYLKIMLDERIKPKTGENTLAVAKLMAFGEENAELLRDLGADRIAQLIKDEAVRRYLKGGEKPGLAEKREEEFVDSLRRAIQELSAQHGEGIADPAMDLAIRILSELAGGATDGQSNIRPKISTNKSETGYSSADNEPTEKQIEQLLSEVKSLLEHILLRNPEIIEEWLRNLGFELSIGDINEIAINYHARGNRKDVFKVEVKSGKGSGEFRLALKSDIGRKESLFEKGELEGMKELQDTDFVPKLGGIVYIERAQSGYGDILREEQMEERIFLRESIDNFITLETEKYIDGPTVFQLEDNNKGLDPETSRKCIKSLMNIFFHLNKSRENGPFIGPSDFCESNIVIKGGNGDAVLVDFGMQETYEDLEDYLILVLYYYSGRRGSLLNVLYDEWPNIDWDHILKGIRWYLIHIRKNLPRGPICKDSALSFGHVHITRSECNKIIRAITAFLERKRQSKEKTVAQAGEEDKWQADVEALAQQTLSGPVSVFIKWLDDILMQTDQYLNMEQLKDIGKRLGLTELDIDRIYKETVARAGHALKFSTLLPNDGKYNVFLFRDSFALYSASRILGSSPEKSRALYLSKETFREFTGLMIADSRLPFMIKKIKKEMGISVKEAVPEEKFGEFKKRFFNLIKVLLDEKISDETIEDMGYREFIPFRKNLRQARAKILKYLRKLNISLDDIRQHGIRFIDTAKAGSFVLFMEGLIHLELGNMELKEEEIMQKTDSRMFYSVLSPALMLVSFRSSIKDAREVETDYYPIRFKKELTDDGEPIIEETDENQKRQFLFQMIVLRNALLQGTANNAQWDAVKKLVANLPLCEGHAHFGGSIDAETLWNEALARIDITEEQWNSISAKLKTVQEFAGEEIDLYGIINEARALLLSDVPKREERYNELKARFIHFAQYVPNGNGSLNAFVSVYSISSILSKGGAKVVRKIAKEIVTKFHERGVRMVELRTSMTKANEKELEDKLRATIEGLREAEVANSGLEARIVVTVEKYNKISDILEQTRVLLTVLRNNPDLREYVVGFDAANAEQMKAPGQFIEVFALIREYNDERAKNGEPKLGLTYHVGEDFSNTSVESGIRHVHEAIDLGIDRIGHGLVLGIDVAQFNGTVREEHISERLAQIYYDLKCAKYDERGLKRAGVIIDKNELDIYRSRYRDVVVLIETVLENQSKERELYTALSALKESNPNEKIKISYDNARCEELVKRQYYVLNKVIERGIVIETNPTSNVCIGPIKSYGEHPIKRFLAYRYLPSAEGENTLVGQRPIVTINTDDAGIFGTTLADEYVNIAVAMGLTTEEIKRLVINGFKHRLSNHPLRYREEIMAKLGKDVEKELQGYQIVDTEFGQVQFTVPSETAKDLMKLHEKDKEFPTTFVLPPNVFMDGCNYADIEFLIYFFAFKVRNGLKINIVLTPEQERGLRRYLEHSMFGIDFNSEEWMEYKKRWISSGQTQEEIMAIERGIKTAQEMFAKGKIDDYINFCPLVNNRVEVVMVDRGDPKKVLGKIEIERDEKDNAKFRVKDTAVTKEVEVDYRRPYIVPVNVSEAAKEQVKGENRPRFGYTILDRNNGFDKKGDTSSFIIWVEGKGILVDPSYTAIEKIEQMGLTKDDIPYILLTHNHAGHDRGVLKWVFTGKRTKILASYPVFFSFLAKSEFLLGESVEKYVDFTPLLDNRQNEITLGETERAVVEIRHNLHSIPSIGFKITYKHEDKNYCIGFSGDTLYDEEKIAEYEGRMVDGVPGTDAIIRNLLNFFWDSEGNLPKDIAVVLHEVEARKRNEQGIHTPMDSLSELPVETRKKIVLYHLPEDKFSDVQDGFKDGKPVQTTAILESDEQLRNNYRFHIISIVAYLSDLDEKTRRKILEKAEIKIYPSGDVLMEEGTYVPLGEPPNGLPPNMCRTIKEGKDFFIILEGTAKITRGGNFINYAGRGTCVGEWALETGSERAATVTAVNGGLKALTLTAEQYKRLIAVEGVKDKVLKARENLGLLQRMQRSHKQNNPFRGLSYNVLVDLATRTKPVTKTNEEIVRQGEKGNTCYIIKKGKVTVMKDGRKLAALSEGGYFGEIALLKGEGERTATVIADGDVELLEITKEQFDKIRRDWPDFNRKVEEEAERRAAQEKEPSVSQPPGIPKPDEPNTAHMEGLKLKNGGAMAWRGNVIEGRNIEDVKRDVKGQSEYIGEIEGKKVWIDEKLSEKCPDFDFGAFLAEQFKNKDTLPKGDEIVIALLSQSEHLFEDCKENGFIGVNEQLFAEEPSLRAPKVAKQSLADGQSLQIKLLKLGLRHELRHEAGVGNSEKEEKMLLSEDVAEAMKIGVSGDEVEILKRSGILEEECGFIKKFRKENSISAEVSETGIVLYRRGSEEVIPEVSTKGVPTGILYGRGHVHRRGIYHPNVRIIVLSPDGKVILGRKTQGPKTESGIKYDSFGGHINEVKDGRIAYVSAALREISEKDELNLTISPDRLKRIGEESEFVFKMDRSEDYGFRFKDNEVSTVYILRLDESEVKRIKTPDPDRFVAKSMDELFGDLSLLAAKAKYLFSNEKIQEAIRAEQASATSAISTATGSVKDIESKIAAAKAKNAEEGWVGRKNDRVLKELDAGFDRRYVIIGDIHGNLSALQQVLRDAGLVDANGDWIGGNAVVVQLGDVIDLGPASNEVDEYLRKLQRGKGQARENGGDVIRLLGNHEAMLLWAVLGTYSRQGDMDLFSVIAGQNIDLSRDLIGVALDDTFKKVIRGERETDNPKLKKLAILFQNILSDVLNGNIQAAYAKNNVLFVHGSIGEYCQGELDCSTAEKVADSLNSLMPKKEEDFGKIPVVLNLALSEYSTEEYHKAVGNRLPAEVEKSLPFLQIVGHTPGNEIRISRNGGVISTDVGIGDVEHHGENRGYADIQGREIRGIDLLYEKDAHKRSVRAELIKRFGLDIDRDINIILEQKLRDLLNILEEDGRVTKYEVGVIVDKTKLAVSVFNKYKGKGLEERLNFVQEIVAVQWAIEELEKNKVPEFVNALIKALGGDEKIVRGLVMELYNYNGYDDYFVLMLSGIRTMFEIKEGTDADKYLRMLDKYVMVKSRFEVKDNKFVSSGDEVYDVLTEYRKIGTATILSEVADIVARYIVDNNEILNLFTDEAKKGQVKEGIKTLIRRKGLAEEVEPKKFLPDMTNLSLVKPLIVDAKYLIIAKKGGGYAISAMAEQLKWLLLKSGNKLRVLDNGDVPARDFITRWLGSVKFITEAEYPADERGVVSMLTHDTAEKLKGKSGNHRVVKGRDDGVDDLMLMSHIAGILGSAEELSEESIGNPLRELYKAYYKEDKTGMVEEIIRAIQNGVSIIIELPPIAPFVKQYYNALKQAIEMTASAA